LRRAANCLKLQRPSAARQIAQQNSRLIVIQSAAANAEKVTTAWLRGKRRGFGGNLIFAHE
jgi:hypothetical protein